MNQKRVGNAFLAAFAAICFTPFAAASPVLWTASGAVFNFEGSGEVTGSFVYDADTQTFSSIDLVSEGDTMTDLIAPLVGANKLGATDTTAADLVGAPAVDIVFKNNLTDAGGSAPLFSAAFVSCFNATCNSTGTNNFGETGSFVGTAVSTTPEPVSLGLSAAGMLVLFGLLARRRIQR